MKADLLNFCHSLWHLAELAPEIAPTVVLRRASGLPNVTIDVRADHDIHRARQMFQGGVVSLIQPSIERAAALFPFIQPLGVEAAIFLSPAYRQFGNGRPDDEITMMWAWELAGPEYIWEDSCTPLPRDQHEAQFVGVDWIRAMLTGVAA